MSIRRTIEGLIDRIRRMGYWQLFLWAAIIICSIIFSVVFLFYFKNLGTAAYPLGDMLINYSCGIVRRGLLGTIMVKTSEGLNLDIFALYGNICLAIYLSVYIYIYVKISKTPLLLLLILIAPFGFMFVVNDWRAFGYKDIFILSFFLVVLNLIKHYQRNSIWFIIVLLMLIATFIHELFVFISCPFILLHLICRKKRGFNSFNFSGLLGNQRSNILFLLLTCSLLCLIVIITSGNNSFVASCLKEGYVNLLKDRVEGPFLTDQTIFWPLEWLEKGIGDAISLTSNNYLNARFQFGAISQLALLGFTLALIIIYGFGFKRVISFLKRNSLLSFYLVLSVASTFIIGSDWGRWMYLLFMHVVIFLAVNNDLIVIRNNDSKQNRKFIYLFLIAIAVFVFIRVPSFYLSGDSLTDTVFVRLLKSFLN